jgi:hypothetical protein
MVERLPKEALVPKTAAPAPAEVGNDTAVVLDIEDDSLVAELTKARHEHVQPAPLGVRSRPSAASSRSPQRRVDDTKHSRHLPQRGLPLQRREKLTVGVGDDIDDDIGAGGSVQALSGRGSSSHVKVVSQNTFLTIQDEEAQEEKDANKRSLSV